VQRLFDGYRSFDLDLVFVEPLGQFFATGAGQELHAIRRAAERGDDVLQRYTAPHDIAGCPGSPLRSAGRVVERAAAITGALQNHYDGCQTHGLEFTDG